MKENVLVDLSKGFAIEIINLCSELKRNEKVAILTSQLLRSGTSIGANIHEGNYAASKADFINKFQIALKEGYETDYWLDIFKETGVVNEEKYTDLKTKNGRTRKILITSIKTAKSSIK
ncbi:MAG: four helix bundle protein [Clostridia bacterium]|nr:four helix bundle protein [Clostridia bacterium]